MIPINLISKRWLPAFSKKNRTLDLVGCSLSSLYFEAQGCQIWCQHSKHLVASKPLPQGDGAYLMRVLLKY